MTTSSSSSHCVIYSNPLDYPGSFVVRPFFLIDGVVYAAALPLAVTGSLEAAREAVPYGLANAGRLDGDDPAIAEVWIASTNRCRHRRRLKQDL